MNKAAESKSATLADDEIIKVIDPRTGEEIPTDQIGLRLTKKEQARYARTLKIVFDRNPYVGKADINRLIIGLMTDYSLLTKEEIEYFRGLAAPPAIPVNVPEAPQKPKEAKEKHGPSDRSKGKERRS